MAQFLATKASFANGRYIPRGHIVELDPALVKASNTNLVPAGDIGPLERVEIAAIGPTGPSPVAPQQVSPDTVQTIEGYSRAGVIQVGEGAGAAADAAAAQREKLADAKTGSGSEAKVAAALAGKSSMLDDEPADPLDHDGDGKKGGSRPRANT